MFVMDFDLDDTPLGSALFGAAFLAGVFISFDRLASFPASQKQLPEYGSYLAIRRLF